MTRYNGKLVAVKAAMANVSNVEEIKSCIKEIEILRYVSVH
jgi:hypothetical protein